MVPRVTLLELVKVVGEYAETEDEVVATVVHLVNDGMVRLIGNFRGCRFDTDDVAAA
jgi:predicted nucleic-acid-binding protein